LNGGVEELISRSEQDSTDFQLFFFGLVLGENSLCFACVEATFAIEFPLIFRQCSKSREYLSGTA
jgi:hypothetical protein